MNRRLSAAKLVTLSAATALLAAASAANAQSYSVGWFSVDGGGSTVNGSGTGPNGTYTLRGTFGQADASPRSTATAGPGLTGGFWVISQPFCRSDYNADGFVNSDDVTDFVTDYFTQPPVPGPGGYAVPCPGAPAPYDTLGYKVDINGDCAVNTDDISDFITAYFQGC